MAQAASADTRSTFLAQLLAPIAAPAANRRLLVELRREAADAWSLVLHRFYAAQALRDHHGHLRRAAEIERRTLNVPEAADEARAQLAMIAAVDRMMHIPAPTIGALRQKEKLRGFDGGRQRWESAIAADAVLLMERR